MTTSARGLRDSRHLATAKRLNQLLSHSRANKGGKKQWDLRLPFQKNKGKNLSDNDNWTGKYIDPSDVKLRSGLSGSRYSLMRKGDTWGSYNNFISFTAKKDPDYPIDVTVHGVSREGGNFAFYSGMGNLYDYTTPKAFGHYLENRFKRQNIRMFACHTSFNVAKLTNHYSGSIKFMNTSSRISFKRSKKTNTFILME